MDTVDRRDAGLVTEGLELVDGAGLGLVRRATDEIVDARVAIELTGSEHVPSGHEHGVFDRDNGSHLAAAD